MAATVEPELPPSLEHDVARDPSLDERSRARKPPAPKDEKIVINMARPSINPERAQCIRIPYRPKTSIDIVPIVNHAEPRAAACHVDRRMDQRVTALPPPSAKTSIAVNLSKGSDGDGQGNEERRLGGDKDDGDRERDDGNDGGNTLREENGEQSGEEYESAAEDPWHDEDEIWE